VAEFEHSTFLRYHIVIPSGTIILDLEGALDELLIPISTTLGTYGHNR
jgi:hypothetical protein